MTEADPAYLLGHRYPAECAAAAGARRARSEASATGDEVCARRVCGPPPRCRANCFGELHFVHGSSRCAVHARLAARRKRRLCWSRRRARPTRPILSGMRLQALQLATCGTRAVRITAADSTARGMALRAAQLIADTPTILALSRKPRQAAGWRAARTPTSHGMRCRLRAPTTRRRSKRRRAAMRRRRRRLAAPCLSCAAIWAAALRLSTAPRAVAARRGAARLRCRQRHPAQPEEMRRPQRRSPPARPEWTQRCAQKRRRLGTQKRRLRHAVPRPRGRAALSPPRRRRRCTVTLRPACASPTARAFPRSVRCPMRRGQPTPECPRFLHPFRTGPHTQSFFRRVVVHMCTLRLMSR